MMIELMGLALLLALQIAAMAGQASTLALTSAAFKNGDTIPQRYTCSGQNESPALEWHGIPRGTRSLVLVVDDPDAPMGTFVHWVIYNLPATAAGLPQAMSASASVGGSEQGTNGRGEIGYTGPCPPPGKPHHYHFRLYALDHKLALKAGATVQQIEEAIKEHVLGSTELIGIFRR
jgi:Raf kinase inhibitor-like YbhB/YbcL family protein